MESSIDAVGDEERITRFLRRESDIHRLTGKPKPSAFKPNLNLDNKTSVFRTSEAVDFEIWAIAREFIEPLFTDGSKIIAMTHLLARNATSEGLQVVASPEVHPLHADIDGWPPREEHERRLQLQTSLAYAASAVTRAS